MFRVLHRGVYSLPLDAHEDTRKSLPHTFQFLALLLSICSLPVLFVSPPIKLFFVFLAEGFGDELTLDWLSDDSEPDEFFLALASLSLFLSLPLSLCLNIFLQDLDRLNSPPLPSWRE